MYGWADSRRIPFWVVLFALHLIMDCTRIAEADWVPILFLTVYSCVVIWPSRFATRTTCVGISLWPLCENSADAATAAAMPLLRVSAVGSHRRQK